MKSFSDFQEVISRSYAALQLYKEKKCYYGWGLSEPHSIPTLYIGNYPQEDSRLFCLCEDCSIININLNLKKT